MALNINYSIPQYIIFSIADTAADTAYIQHRRDSRAAEFSNHTHAERWSAAETMILLPIGIKTIVLITNYQFQNTVS